MPTYREHTPKSKHTIFTRYKYYISCEHGGAKTRTKYGAIPYTAYKGVFMNNTYILEPIYSRRKSFYNKARVIIADDDDIILQSYTTNVANYNTKTKKFTKLWNGYSRTTMEHIEEFCKQHDIDFIPNKKNWLNLPYDNDTTRYYIKGTNGFVYHESKETIFDNYDDAQEYADSLTNNFWSFWVEEL